MTLKFTPDGKVDRVLCARDFVGPDDLADALDECVAALRQTLDFWRASGSLTADDVQSNVESALRKIGAIEP